MRTVWLNGKLVREDEARISPFDRGLLLADGVFETMRCYGGRCYRSEAHLARLREGCAHLRLPFPEGLGEAVRDTLRANGLVDAAVRITLTRGPGGRGASPRGAGPPTVLVTAVPVPEAPASVRVVTVPFPRTDLSGVKTVSYVSNVMARIHAEEAGADDALFVDSAGFVVEATQANVFAFLGDALVTPPLRSGCLPGVTRADVLALAGPSAQERDLTVAELTRADEVFLTASVSEVVPVIAIDGALVAKGEPGPRTRALHTLYRKRAQPS